jgi:ABC-type multidrug transport system ATPase subunit
MHAGRVVALDAPQALLRALGAEVLEVRVDGDPTAALTKLRAHGMATDDVFSLGGTLTIPLHGSSAETAVLTINQIGLNTTELTTRRPTLDDVYLRLTGGRLAAA